MKKRIGILFGGRSGEHEVSLRSGASILKAIDRRRYEVVPLGITREGRWLAPAEAQGLLGGSEAAAFADGSESLRLQAGADVVRSRVR